MTEIRIVNYSHLDALRTIAEELGWWSQLEEHDGSEYADAFCVLVKHNSLVDYVDGGGDLQNVGVAARITAFRGEVTQDLGMLAISNDDWGACMQVEAAEALLGMLKEQANLETVAEGGSPPFGWGNGVMLTAETINKMLDEIFIEGVFTPADDDPDDDDGLELYFTDDF